MKVLATIALVAVMNGAQAQVSFIDSTVTHSPDGETVTFSLQLTGAPGFSTIDEYGRQLDAFGIRTELAVRHRQAKTQ